MNYERGELLERLAAEYVLGTLSEPARRRFAALLRGHFAARHAVQQWERRLAPLALAVQPVEPPRRIWRQIHRKLGFGAPAGGSGFSPALAATLLLMLGAMAGWLISQTQLPETAGYVAVVTDPEKAPVWLIEVYPQRSELRVQALGELALSAEQAYELWMLPDDGTAPVSLGLLPLSGETALPLAAAQLDGLAAASVLAVSLEPAGGSPTGAPTGPVVYTAPLIRS